MITLKNAISLVMRAHPDEEIQVVNEYNEAFQFILLPKGEEIGSMSFVYNTPGVDKVTGELLDGANMLSKCFIGNYRQYSKKDIESL